MALKIAFRKIHKWIALIVGVQVLAWTASGLVMSFFPIEKVRGEHRMAEPDGRPLDPDAVGRSLSDVLGDQAVQEARLRRLLDRHVYELKGPEQIRLVDAGTGETLSPLSRELAEAIARADYAGEAGVADVSWLETRNTEYRKAVPVWRVVFDDDDGTHLYVSPFSGEITARRSSLWRFYDFFWMLHIMDYDERSDFNHPLLIGASILGVAVSVSGIALLFVTVRRRDLRRDWRWFRRFFSGESNAP